MKIAFCMLEIGAVGGVEKVNVTLAREFMRRGHEVAFFSLCTAGEGGAPEGARAFSASAEKWRFTEGKEIRAALFRKKLFTALRLYFQRRKDEKAYRRGIGAVREALRREAPDAIVTSHYLLLDAVPEEFLPRTVHHAHTSFEETKAQRAGYETLLKYKEKIRFVFLSRASLAAAKKEGFENAVFLYNPVSVSGRSQGGDLIALTRLSPEKEIPRMVRLARRALEETGASARLLIYGEGEEREAIEKEIAGDARFRLMGGTDDPAAALSGAALHLNTSRFEGFSVAVLEAAACGVPTLAFAFEAFGEEILDGVTGTLVPEGDEEAFAAALCRYLSDPGLCRRHGENARAWARSFAPEKIADRWEKEVFSPLDKAEKM